ncbi:MAG: hypothetical protein ACRDK3_10260 [Actinomycetota bacterium]
MTCAALDRAGIAVGVRDPETELGYQSESADAVTGNILVGPRQYDPTIQRFTTTDVFIDAGPDLSLATDPSTGNRYLFAAANSVALDDNGHEPCPGAPGTATVCTVGQRNNNRSDDAKNVSRGSTHPLGTSSTFILIHTRSDPGASLTRRMLLNQIVSRSNDYFPFSVEREGCAITRARSISEGNILYLRGVNITPWSVQVTDVGDQFLAPDDHIAASGTGEFFIASRYEDGESRLNLQVTAFGARPGGRRISASSGDRGCCQAHLVPYGSRDRL